LLSYRTASLHIRRGDFIQYRINFDKSYYLNALSLFNDIEKVLIFSDDLSWCRENFVGKNFEYIDEGIYGDMCLMTLLDINVICNSSYGWWGAYLNSTKGHKVFCPLHNSFLISLKRDKMLNGSYLYPKEWIRINNRPD